MNKFQFFSLSMGTNVNLSDFFKQAPLHKAMQKMHKSTVQSKSANIDKCDPFYRALYQIKYINDMFPVSFDQCY